MGTSLSHPHPPETWDLTTQDHAVVQVHGALKQHQAELKGGLVFTGGVMAALAAMGAAGALPGWAALAGGAACLTLLGAIPMAHHQAQKALLQTLTPDGPDVEKVRAWLHAQRKDLGQVTGLLAVAGAFFAGAALALGPWWVVPGLLGAAGVWAAGARERRRLDAQLHQLGEDPRPALNSHTPR